ncbi:DUF1775 domain-containing protein [Microbacterium sp. 179-B 1A2 NHS]|uniref:DUF1775 domain-containing protein n=1 Tax=Microbacterium sp. 179-B 1A2 NHS TaxID=3142383 RepID=UPI00399F145E
MTLRSARRSALTLTAVALGGALALAVPMAASAHVHATADGATAGSTSRVEFSFSHGCDGSPTTALVVDLPDTVETATPVVDGVWTVERELADNGLPTSVTYTAVTPIEDGLAASVAMDVVFGSEAADTEVAFPVTQECASGETAWVEVPEEGQDPHELEAPAPTVAVAAASASDADSDGHAHADEHADTDEHAAADADESAATAAAATDDTGVWATWLAGGALAVSVAALAVALIRRRA